MKKEEKKTRFVYDKDRDPDLNVPKKRRLSTKEKSYKDSGMRPSDFC